MKLNLCKICVIYVSLTLLVWSEMTLGIYVTAYGWIYLKE